MRFPWLVSATNTTPYWESGLFSSITDDVWPVFSNPDLCATTKPAFGIWFKCLSPYTVTNSQPLYSIGVGAGQTIGAALTAANQIEFSWTEFTSPYFSGGSATVTETFTHPTTLDDGNWHFVGFALTGGKTSGLVPSNRIVHIVDYWSKEHTGTADAIGVISADHWLRIGRASGFYAEHIEYAEPTFYWADRTGTSETISAESLKNHWQFGPLQQNETTNMEYAKWIVAQWRNEPQYIDDGSWRGYGTSQLNLTWKGVTGLETLPKDTFPRGEIIGSLFDRKEALSAHPKSWAGNLGHSMKFVGQAVSGWDINLQLAIPYLYSFNITANQALDIPSGQKSPTMDNSVYVRNTKLMKRHPV